MSHHRIRLGRKINKTLTAGVGAAVLLLAATLATASEHQSQEGLAADRLVPFTLGAGDVLSVFIFQQPTLSTDVSLTPDGKISYPLVGEIDAAGLTMSEVEEAITRGLQRHIHDPQVTVILKEVHSFQIYVLGEVANPGAFELRGAVTVIQAIAMAGGLTPYASRSKIVVVNPLVDNGQRFLFDYQSYVEGSEVDQNIVLRAGDVVFAP